MEDVYDSDDDHKQVPKYDPLPDFHLRNPLHSIHKEVQGIIQKSKRAPKRKNHSLLSLKRYGDIKFIGSPTDLIIKCQLFVTPESTDGFSDALKDAQTRIAMDGTVLTEADLELWNTSLTNIQSNFKIKLWNTMRSFQASLKVINALSSRRPPPPGYVVTMPGFVKTDLPDGSEMYFTMHYIGIRMKASTDITLYDPDWWRMATDLHTERFLLWLGSTIGHFINPAHYPTSDLIWEVISWGDIALARWDNSAYKLLKTYEALCMGVLQASVTSKLLENSRFLKNTLNDLYAEDADFGVYANELIGILSEIKSKHHLTQLFGLHRIWGHPIVDSSKGMEKVIIIGQKELEHHFDTPNCVSDHFKRMFCTSFRSKNKKFPLIQPGTSRLHGLISSNNPEALNKFIIQLSEWRSIEFAENFSLPETFNLSMIVADKGISPTKSELLINVQTRKTVMNQEQRRGVLRWINDDTLDPRDFLNDVNNGNFPDEHKIIGLTPKERELNPTPRMFALMSHLMRVYVVITESMLSEHILPHFHQITMTDSLLDLTKKIYTTVRDQSAKFNVAGKRKHKRVVCISLDFEKWNGHMRKQCTEGIFTSLGNLFGKKELYNRTYDIFSESYIYLADGSYLPKFDDEGRLITEPPMSFTGHRGGMEGLRQKGWTIFTVTCLDYILSRHNCNYKIMGMGDNQVLQITLYSNEVDLAGHITQKGLDRMKTQLFRIFDDLISTFQELGLPLKPLETWMSEDLFAYGKFPIWRGVPLSMDLKKIMRMFPFSNEDIMTVENIMGTISGNATSAVQMSPSIGVSYMIGIIQMSLAAHDLLLYHPLIAKGLIKSLSAGIWKFRTGTIKTIIIDLPSSNMEFGLLRNMLFTVPRTLGGYVSFSLIGLMMRGFPDGLTRDLTAIRRWETETSEGSIIHETLMRWVNPIYMPGKNYQLLLEDVASVNLLSPVTPTSKIRQTVEKYLKSGRAVKNTEFREMMNVKNKEMEELLSEYMCEGDTLHVRLLHDIYEATIPGYVSSITSKVIKSSTIQRLAIGESKNDILSRVLADEENYFCFFFWRCHISPEPLKGDCPTQWSKELRKTGWGKEIKGVTIAHPAGFMQLTECHQKASCMCDEQGYVSVHYPDNQLDTEEWNHEIGKSPPYLGSITKEKVVTMSTTRVYSSEPLVKRPINLLRTINWFVPPESNTAAVIKSCLEAITDADPAPYIGVPEGISGAEVHRYNDSSLKHGALTSSSYLYSSRYHVSTDMFSAYSKGAANYDLHFQALLCYIVEKSHINITTANTRKVPIKKYHHYRQVCQSCISLVDDQFHDIPSERVRHLLPSCKTNKYLYVTEARISKREIHLNYSNLNIRLMSEREYKLLSQPNKLSWMHDSFADAIAGDLIDSTSQDNAAGVSLYSVKEYTRTAFVKMSPKRLLDAVMNRLYIMGEWRCYETASWKRPTPQGVIRAVKSILTSCSVEQFLGLTLFYTWPEFRGKMNFYPEMVSPDTVPTSISSAGRAVRTNLYSLADYTRSFPGRTTSVITEDHRNNGTVYKFILYNWVKNNSKGCHACVAKVGSMRPSEFVEQGLRVLCRDGHMIFEKLKGVDVMTSRVTLDRLRKDTSSTDESFKSYGNFGELSMINGDTTVVSILNSGRHISRPCDYHPLPSLGRSDLRLYGLRAREIDMMKVYSLPTGARYKYLEIYSYYRQELKKTVKAMFMGDGLGSTSELFVRLFKKSVVISTIIDNESAIPQSYPHMFQPELRQHPALVDDKSMINLHNDITAPNWVSEWRPKIKDCDVLISDVEIDKASNWDIRSMMITKISSMKCWRFAIVKDYIYSAGELNERLTVVMRCWKRYELITCYSRQSFKPEFWWILHECNNSRAYESSMITYHDTAIHTIWDNCILNLQRDHSLGIIHQMNNILVNYEPTARMFSRVKSWCQLPIVGDCLPSNGGYTRLLGYLQKGRKPRDVDHDKVSQAKKLRTTEEMELREKLFTMAVSMLACAKDRLRLYNDSHHWGLAWSIIHSKASWTPFLYFDQKEDWPSIDTGDLIPTMCLLMQSQKLLFNDYEEFIEFETNYKREKLCFPVTKASLMKMYE
ncbi:TPA_asm: L [Oak alphacytorhabdovirus 1]|nr:TPA_asm: L [Oak alphacytorhabdovirus 1]